jgi:hypothetical protein
MRWTSWRAPDRKAELIQVCADVSDPVTVRRELRALTEAVQPAYEWYRVS